MPGPKPLQVTATERQKDLLETIVRRQKSEQRLVRRARIVLLAAQGQGNEEIARQVGTSRQIVRTWRKRWYEALTGFELVEQKLAQPTEYPDSEQVSESQYTKMIHDLLSDRERSGKPPDFTAEQIVQLLALACKEPTQLARPVTHWTPRELRDEAVKQEIFESISVRQVGRFLKRSRLETPSKPLLVEF